MSEESNGLKGVLIYVAVTLLGVIVVSSFLRGLGTSARGPVTGALVVIAMWFPSLARFSATRIADRDWRTPFPLKYFGHPRMAVMLIPLCIVSAIYIFAYVFASLLHVEIQPPVWRGASVAINIALNLPMLALVDAAGALGEELGWRGYLQPRLHQLGVRCSVLWVIIIETLFHVPLILMGTYLSSNSARLTILLFFGLKLGATPLWTWATYRSRSIWAAIWFHAFHNAVSQVLAPKGFGAGDPRILGESGILPVIFYLAAAVIMFFSPKSKGGAWGLPAD